MASSAPAPKRRRLVGRDDADMSALLPTPRLNWNMSADEISSEKERIETAFAAELDAIAAEPSPSYERTFARFSEALADASLYSSQCTLPALVSQCPTARQRSSQSKKDLKAMFASAFRRDVYDALVRASRSQEPHLTSSQAAFQDQILQMFERRGVSLPTESQRNRVHELSNRIASLEGEFEQAINEDTTVAHLAHNEMNGLTKGFLEGLPISPEDPTARTVSMKAPQLVPVMKLCTSSDARKRVQHISQTRCPANEQRLAELVQARHDRANLLGFESHAEFMLAPKMSKNVQTVRTFMDDMIRRLEKPMNEDLAALYEIAKQESKDEEGSPKVASWDVSYYSRILKEKTHSIDDELIREYFPLEHVRATTLSIYEHFLNLEFRQFEDASMAGAWHKDVEAFAVLDKSSGALLGHFFIDLFSRDGKFGHQMVVALAPSFLRANGVRQHPIASIIGNMTKPTETRPALLSHREVHTFFHEFGHVVHAVLSKVDHSIHAWTWPMMPWPGGVQQDYLEVPSMFLELFVYREDVLGKLSKHYKTGERMPSDMMSKIASAKNFLAGMRYRRFLAFAYFDMIVHGQREPPFLLPEVLQTKDHQDQDNNRDSRGDGGFRDLWAQCMTNIYAFAPQEGAHYYSTWYHLAIGYDAGYFGYLWSEVYGVDVFSCFRGIDIFSQRAKELGMQYRKTMLEPGASEDGVKMLEGMLGRAPNQNAFLEEVFGQRSEADA